MSRPRSVPGGARVLPRRGPGRRRTSAVVALLALCLAIVGPAALPAPSSASAGDDDPGLDVRLTALSPTTLDGRPARVGLAGTVTNRGDRAWTDAVVYLVTRPTPYDSRAGLDDAVREPRALSVGERRIGASTTARVGTVGPGESLGFSLSVPYADLGLSGAEGVYPIGAQVLATPASGERAATSVGGAFTFLPLVGAAAAADAVDVSVVVPFVAPVRRTTRGRYTDSAGLLALVGDDGRLRRLLDLTRDTVDSGGEAARGTTLVLDPALLDALDDLSDRRYGPGGPEETDDTPGTEPTPGPTDTADAEASGSTEARAFLDDLVALAQTQRTWVLAYGQPDVQALLEADGDPQGPLLARIARQAASDAVERYGIEGRPVFWPANGIASASTVDAARAAGDQGALLSPRVLPGWSPGDGPSLLLDGAPGARVLVRDPAYLRGGSDRTALGVRQRTLAEAALSALEGGATRQVIPVLGPDWDPGAETAAADLEQVFDAPFTRANGPDDDAVGWDGGVTVPRRLAPTPVRAGQVDSARSLVATADDLGQVTDDDSLTRFYLEGAALTVSQLWRKDQAEGARRAIALDRAASARLGGITIETIPVLTLSGTSGNIPLSVTNQLDRPVTVGVRLRSTSGAVDVPDVQPFELQPDQRQTIRVAVDVGESTNAAMTAQLTTPDGSAFGQATRFNVRSSIVGRAVWLVMGGSAALVLVAFGRRFVLARRDPA